MYNTIPTAYYHFLSEHVLQSNEPTIKRSRSSLVHMEPSISFGDNFEKLVKNSSIFVDKSLFIKEIIESKDEVTLVTRPNRWGRSMNLDMLKRFLSVEADDTTGSIIPHTQTDNYKLFAGGNRDVGSGKIKNLEKLKIASDEYCMKYQGRFPVIFIDFKNCKIRMDLPKLK